MNFDSKWYALLLLPPFIKSCVLPTYSSALELSLFVGLVAFLTYRCQKGVTDPQQEKLAEAVVVLQSKSQNLQEQMNNLRVKLFGSRMER